ncbi:hypothetical protein, partial [Vibrio alfacsensis]
HIGAQVEDIAFDDQAGFYTQSDQDVGNRGTEAKQNEFMSVKFTAGLMTRALVGVGGLTAPFSAAANSNAQIFVYLYAGGV